MRCVWVCLALREWWATITYFMVIYIYIPFDVQKMRTEAERRRPIRYEGWFFDNHLADDEQNVAKARTRRHLYRVNRVNDCRCFSCVFFLHVKSRRGRELCNRQEYRNKMHYTEKVSEYDKIFVWSDLARGQAFIGMYVSTRILRELFMLSKF